MAGRWSEDQERYWRDRDRGRYDDRYDVFGLNDERERWSGAENRSFDHADYNRARSEEGRGYRGGNWQDRDYGGPSPAMRRGDYDTGYRANPRIQGQDYTRDYGGGRFYGDDGRGRIYREEYGYGESPRYYKPEGHRFGSYEADRRWEREMHRPVSGGYDHERGYEERARDAGDFLRRAGQRISHWFSDVAGDVHGEDERRYEAYRGARGLGPRDYKRSDERISDDAHQRLTDDPWLDATHIGIAVAGGEVTLSGSVDSREAKHRAERIVEDLSGVTHVQNNLRVQPGNFFTSAGRGYGDSVQEARMASSEPARDVTDGNTSPPAQKRN